LKINIHQKHLSMKPFCKIARLCLSFIILTACASNEKLPSQRLQIESERARYTFAEPDTTWDTFFTDSQAALFRVNEDALEGAVIGNRGYLWSLDHQPHTNVAIAASVRQTEGLPGNGFGIMCRADAMGNGYYFLISSEGFFSISKATSAKGDLVQVVPWQRGQSIYTGEAVNELLAICAGNYLAFFINDVFVAEARDDDFSSGQAGVALGAVGETLWVRFDDIVISDVSILGPR
jgi:hypothetical protein